MFTTIECSVVVRASLEETWKAFADLSRLLGRGIYDEAAWVEGTPWQVGSRIHYRVQQPLEAGIDAVITAIDPPHQLQIVNHSMGITADQLVVFRPTKEGMTRISARVEFLGRSPTLPADQIESAVRFLVQDALDTVAARFSRK